MKSKSPILYIIIIIVIALIWLHNKRIIFSHENETANKTETFDRSNDHLIITKHAHCRMECRHITAEEIEEILHKGNINFAKSKLVDARGPKYALEGYSKDQQHLRIIFAPEDDGMVVVTAIDLDEEWPCHCN